MLFLNLWITNFSHSITYITCIILHIYTYDIPKSTAISRITKACLHDKISLRKGFQLKIREITQNEIDDSEQKICIVIDIKNGFNLIEYPSSFTLTIASSYKYPINNSLTLSSVLFNYPSIFTYKIYVYVYIYFYYDYISHGRKQ